MKITFLRHATTELNGKGYIATKLDYPLNENGRKQCEQIGFKDGDFDVVFCTPYKRTIETALRVYPYKKAIIEPLIVQRDLGVLTEKFKKDYPEDYVEKVRDYTLVPEGAESLEDIISRIDKFFKYLKENYSENDRILIVGHNGIMRIIRKYYMKDVSDVDTNNLCMFDFYLES